MLDWDFARPGDPIEDLAWAAWRWAPLMAGTWWHAEYGIEEGDDIEKRQRTNLAALVEGYTPTSDQRVRLAAAIGAQMTSHADDIDDLACTDPAFAALVDRGYVQAARDDAAWWAGVGEDWIASLRPRSTAPRRDPRVGLMSIVEFDASAWQGRDDGEGVEYRRWHQQVKQTMAGRTASGGDRVALVGFSSEEGVRRNGGRLGAAEGPDALRKALAPLAMHTDVALTDTGTVVVEGEDLEAGHDALGTRIADALDTEGTSFVVVLGGGHETAWGSYLGRTRSQRLAGRRVGVVNLDAHFDLRQADHPTSGTPFLQMAHADEKAGRSFDYTVIGIAEPSNTRVLFDTADSLGAKYVLDVDAQPSHLDDVLAVVDGVLARVDAVHLSIDLDVMPAAVAPGVSAPAGYGVPVEVLEAVCRRIAASGKLAVLDIVELCPRLDVDGRTAKTAARLVTTCVHAR